MPFTPLVEVFVVQCVPIGSLPEVEFAAYRFLFQEEQFKVDKANPV